MFLEEAGGDGVGYLAFDSPLDDGSLMFAERHDDDLAGFQNSADTHSDGLVRHILFAEEITSRVSPGHWVERHQAGPAMPCGARFVEADVARPADAEQLQVDAARPANELLIKGAILLRFRGRDRPVRNVDVLRLEVDVVEKRLIHPKSVALRILRRHRVVFVEVEGDDPRKIEAGLVQADQFTIQPHGSRAGRQAKDSRLSG